MPPSKKAKAPASPPDNALARQAIEAIAQIEREAEQKKQLQAESLLKARESIMERVEELNHQLGQIDKALAAITGHAAPVKEKRVRRDLTEVRERIGRWMEGRRGEKFGAGDLVKEFPELEGTAVSYVLKPLVDSGKVHSDLTDGPRRPKYFVPA